MTDRPFPTSISRRAFVGRLGAASFGAAALNAAFASPAEAGKEKPPSGKKIAKERRHEAYDIRHEAAKVVKSGPWPIPAGNGDEQRYANRIGSFSKGLPHNGLGEVDRPAYDALQQALTSREPGDFERIPLGGQRRLTNPQAAFAFDLTGGDSHQFSQRPAPALASAETAAELVELYWMALARDVSFVDYGSDPTIGAACGELTGLTDSANPRQGAFVTPATLFRGMTPGDLLGPYLSQFLWLDIPMGALPIRQQMTTVVPGLDYMTNEAEWLAVQNGHLPGPNTFDATPRYIRNLRDLAQWVHVDALYQAYHQACLILLGTGAPLDAGNPYNDSLCQDGFGTFGGPHILSLVTEVATRALKAVWYQKWVVHKRLRPETLAGRVHHTLNGAKSYPVHPSVLNSASAAEVRARTGTWLLPMAFPEGSPVHPSYGAGHATVAGACVTILKAWFDESYVLPDPVVTDRDGIGLTPYTGPALTVGNELNKLAANVGIGRNGAGVHYRSDYTESLRLGEAVAIWILAEMKATYNEPFQFHLTTFDGATITI